MGDDAGDGLTLNYWRLSYRRRLVRDLWLTPVFIAALVLVGYATGWNVAPIIGIVVPVWLFTTVLNYRMYRIENQVAERLADGVSTGWRPLAVVVDGRPLPTQWPGTWAATHMIVTGDRYEVLVNGRPFETGTSRTAADGEVRQAEVLPATGRRAGQTLAQISRVDGDVLTACAAGPDAPRPAAFSSTPGSGHTLSVWLRVR